MERTITQNDRAVLDETLNLRITATMRRDLQRRAISEDRSEGYIARKAIAHYLATEAA
jgi:predicted transcriptional regulator